MRMRKYLTALAMMLAVTMGIIAPETVLAANPGDRMVDESDVLTDEEEQALRDACNTLSEDYQIDVSVVFVKEYSQYSIVEAADDYYDYNGYGLGADRDGIMLFVCDDGYYQERYITTCGKGISYFSDSDIQDIGDVVRPELMDGYYYDGCVDFIRLCEEEIERETQYPIGQILIISLALGAIVGLIYVFALKSQLKSVAPNESAADYMVRDSLHITEKRAQYLYSHVTAIPKPKDTGGGSSTHMSSSGTTHGGGRI